MDKKVKTAILVTLAICLPICACLGYLPAEAAGFTLLLGAVTANQVTQRSGHENRVRVRVAGSKHLYEGTLAFYDSDGYVTDVAGGNYFAGVMVQEADNSSGSDGDIEAEVYYEATFVMHGTGFDQHDVGLQAFATDNYTVTTTEAGNTYIGEIVEYLSSTSVRVRIVTGQHAY